jgi:sporulation protein YlmC with PRC-barrel domain
MRLELGSRVDCTDGTFGKLADVVIDPTTRRITHLVVESDRDLAHLVPVELATQGDDGAGSVVLRATVEEVRRLPGVHELAYLRLGDFPLDDPNWEVGVEEVLALPYFPPFDIEPVPIDYSVAYDRIPKGEVEARRASQVFSSDGHDLGHVEGFVVDPDEHITHVVLERGHLWGRRDVTIPIGGVARVETDVVTLSLTKDEVEALPSMPVSRWPRAAERDGHS